MKLFSGNSHKVIVSREDVARFNAGWPCSNLDSDRHYWFEFDASQDLIDHDVPEHSDGPEAKAISDDCGQWLFYGDEPFWAEFDQ